MLQRRAVVTAAIRAAVQLAIVAAARFQLTVLVALLCAEAVTGVVLAWLLGAPSVLPPAAAVTRPLRDDGAVRVLVTGASGTLGRRLLPRLIAAGADVRAISRQPRVSTGDVEWRVVDLHSGAGLDAAVAGVDAVIHCASAPRGDESAARNLVDALQRGGPPAHLIYISIVGVDRVPLGYYRGKLAVERVVVGSGVPHTIVRATQFHDLLLRLFTVQRRLPVVLVPAGTGFQPIDAGEVADRLVQYALGEPSGRIDDLGGPEVVDASEVARRYLRATGRRRAVVPVRVPGKVGRGYRGGGHLAPGHVVGRVTFEEFLADQVRP